MSKLVRQCGSFLTLKTSGHSRRYPTLSSLHLDTLPLSLVSAEAEQPRCMNMKKRYMELRELRLLFVRVSEVNDPTNYMKHTPKMICSGILASPLIFVLRAPEQTPIFVTVTLRLHIA